MSKEDEKIWPGRGEKAATTQEKKFEAIQKERSERFRQKDHEIWTGPDESDCPTSPIAEQLQEQSQKLDEFRKVLDALVYRLAPVLTGNEPVLQGSESEKNEPKCSSELALALSHDVNRIDEMQELVVRILHRLEI